MKRGTQSCTSCGRVLRRRLDVGNTTARCRCGGVVVTGAVGVRAKRAELERLKIGERVGDERIDVHATLRAQTDAVRPRLPEVKDGH